uniref:Uncharacterized protein n=1 Tax=Rhizophora mucronata TaxID=61149 RepID=A0A2P2JDG8_RHIMU
MISICTYGRLYHVIKYTYI